MNPRRQAIIAALGAVIVTVLFFMFALRPKLNQISQVRDDIGSAQDEQSTLQQQLSQLQEAQEQRPRTISRLALANRFIPTGADLPGFIRQIQAAATASGLELQSIAPAAPRELEGATEVQVIDVTITVEGGFFRLEDMLIRLENLERLVEVRSLTVSPQTDPLTDQTTLTTSLSLQMYIGAPNARVSGTTGSSASSSTTSTEETS